jgi:HSP20 family molecular chaperone IbpA
MQTIETRQPQSTQTNDDSGRHKPESRLTFTPQADVIETSESYTVDVYMPGVSDKSVEATVENDVLSIRGHVEHPNPGNLRLAYQEYELGDYRRVFVLSDGIDRDRISATVRDGMLHMVLPKSEHSKARRIAIQPAS